MCPTITMEAIEKNKPDLGNSYLANNSQGGTTTIDYVSKLIKQQKKWIRLLKTKRRRHTEAIQIIDSVLSNEQFIMDRLRKNEVDAKNELLLVFLVFVLFLT